VNDPILLRLGEQHFWLALADSDALLYAAGVAAAGGYDVEIREPDVAPMQVQGPKSKDVIRSLFGDDVADLRYYWCMASELDGVPLVVSRTGWTGEVGYEIYLRDGSRGDDLWNRVMQAGEPHGIRAIAPSEARRIEAGIFNYGSDMRVEDTPFHVTGLERLVEPDQTGDFIGKEALARIRDEGVDRKLVGIGIGGDPLSEEGAVADFRPVLVDGQRVGKVTGAAWSPRLERNVGYAWVPIELAGEGTTLEVAVADGSVPATVEALPFVDPEKRTPKS
jgi:aminomethyltransferase